MFRYPLTVKMADTDVAGIIYFASEFRFMHDAWEGMIEFENMSFREIFTAECPFLVVIVHAECDYISPITIGDKIEIEVMVERIGSSSFTLRYETFLKEPRQKVGAGKTIHVAIDKMTRKKTAIPAPFKAILQKHIA